MGQTIQVPGTFENIIDGKLANAEQIYDATEGKSQSAINAKVKEDVEAAEGDISNLQTAVADTYNKSAIDTALSAKQDSISDLATIRSGASAGATAVQPADMTSALADKQDTIADLATIRSGASAGATAVQPADMTSALSDKQDTIADLATIRSGASAGATAVQPADMTSALADKQDTIADLATIRSGASAGATAVQPADMTSALADKQDTIADLATIRSGASAGATAVQPAALEAEVSRAQAAELTKANAADVYTKTEVNGMVSTPHQNYVTVADYASLPAVADGQPDTIYRVANYDGAYNSGAGRVDATKYTEYAYSNNALILLSVKSAVGEVFDISEYNSNAIYNSLTEALGTNGANIPAGIRRGGMSVKFVKRINYALYNVTVVSNQDSSQVPGWGDSGNIDINEPLIEGNNITAEAIVANLDTTVVADHSEKGDALAAIQALDLNGSAKFQYTDTYTPEDQQVGIPVYTLYTVTKTTNEATEYVQYRLMSTVWSIATSDWQGIDDEPTAGSNNLVRSGGVQKELAFGAVYDVSAKNPTAGSNNDGKFDSLSALLSDANLNTLIPTAVRKGGMSIKFVQSSDNKYVQYRLLADSFTIDTTQWAIADESVYVENPEFIYVKTDKEGKILWAIKTDGGIYYGAGVPQQVIDYINEKIAELSLDEYEDIVTFLNDLEKGDKTLQDLLNEKVDKEEGKSLINAEYANGVHYIENPEFVYVKTDSGNKILFGIKVDGEPYFGVGCPEQVKEYVEKKIADLSLDEYEDIVTFLSDYLGGDATLKSIIDNLTDTKADKVDGKSLIDTEYANGVSHIENPEFVDVKIDAKGKILWAIKADGSIYYGAGVPQQVIDYIEEKIADLSLDEYEDIVAFLSDYLGSDTTLKAIIGEWDDIVQGKKISILGDSISTFNQEGYKIDGYLMYYPTAAGDRGADVTTVNDTWWMQVINSVEGSLEVNASSSGSTASSRVIGFSPRVPLLGNPDIIYVALGTNDSFNSVTVGEINFEAETYDLTQFAPAYIKGMQDTIAAYPKAKIVCVAFDMGASYQNAIRTIAEHYGAEYIYVGDISDVHPNKAEMAAAANRIIPSAKYTITDAIKTLSNCKADKETGKSLVDTEYANSLSSTKDNDWMNVEIDSEDKILGGRKRSGVKKEIIGFETPYIDVDGNVSNTIDDSDERVEIKTDSTGKILSYRDKKGVLHEEAGIETKNAIIGNAEIKGGSAILDELNLTEEAMTEFQQVLIDSGFDPNNVLDWSNAKSLEIGLPRCAIVNITNADGTAVWPTSKPGRWDYNPGVNGAFKYYLEFWDMQGNYFKKEIILDAQGSSSMAFTKKNGGFDITNNNGWDDDDTFKLKIGDWVAQDSFHLKAYYVDYLRGGAVVAYQLADEIYKTRGCYKDRPWKKALVDYASIPPYGLSEDGTSDLSLQVDTGARCMPDGFPCIVYLNGEFYGIYCWQLKKHRDNYHMTKDNPLHIHLDGQIDYSSMFDGSINWTLFEVRNPKNLVYAEPHFLASVLDWSSTTNYAKGAKVKVGSYQYESKQNSNKNHSVTDTDWWKIDTCGFKYDADVTENKIAGNDDGSQNYDAWSAGSYAIGKIVSHNGHLFLNAVADNTAEPIYHNKNNSDKSPDFKNKTGCGWINCTNTVKVKETIINFSNRVGEINTLNSTDSAAAKELFDTYFDAENIIDYQIINMVIDDYDAFMKNWQWITYDGIKWYVCQYDKDLAFGNFSTGVATRAPQSLPWPDKWESNNTNLPTGLAIRYYSSEHKQRWRDLVSDGIITSDHIERMLTDWVLRVGMDNYKKEWKKWSDSPCNRDSKINFDYWKLVKISLGTATQNIWNDQDSYQIGDTVNINVEGGYAIFEAVADNQNENPIIENYTDYPTNMGYRDSLWRFFKFVELNIEDRDEFMNS
jgi:hypothetical protein